MRAWWRSGTVTTQQLAVPAYIHPAADPDSWARLLTSAPGAVGLVVANVVNGPDYVERAEWAAVLRGAGHAGITVLGYVDTGYLGTTGQRTRLGSVDADDWISQAQRDSASWYDFYGTDIGGVFFDQVPSGCGPEPGAHAWADRYRRLREYVKGERPGAITVANPGTAVPACFADAADVLVTFEGGYDAYLGHGGPGVAYRRLDWEPEDPRQVWHLVHGAGTARRMERALARSRRRRAGYVYVTANPAANPYGALPPPAYWRRQQAQMGRLARTRRSPAPGGPAAEATGRGGPPRDPPAAPPAAPRNVIATEFRHTAVRLAWTPAADGPVAAGYDVVQDDVRVLHLDATCTAVTVGGLRPGGAYVFAVRAVDGSGTASAASTPVTVSTPALPDGRRIVAPAVAQTPETIVYRATFLVPFAFRRVFIATGAPGHAGWWTGSRPQLRADYVLENDRLLKYAGTGLDWSWQPVGPVALEHHGAASTWTVSPADLGGPSATTAVFHGEGYAPSTYCALDGTCVSPGI